jgi:Xaa-Pro aminopeptidase
VFKTMIPYNNWCPLNQILVLYAKEPGRTVERLSIARNTDMKGLHQTHWDFRAFDVDKKEGQWQCLARTVSERDPKRIAIHESEGIWAASGLSSTDKKKLVDTIGPKYTERLCSAEPLVTKWLATMLDEDLVLCERAHIINHGIVDETLSNRAVTPGVTTTEDVQNYYWQRTLSLGLSHYGAAPRAVVVRAPELASKMKGDVVLRPGDLFYLETGITYLRYYTDCREWAYVLKPGESDVPDGYRRIMAEVNRLQDVFCGELKPGLTGNQILKNVRAKATALGVSDFQIYSHSLGYTLHQPSLIGLPWGDGQAQAETAGRGDVPVVANSTFAAEMNVLYPIPEWGGAKLRMQLENGVAVTDKGVRWLDRRQTKFHVIT